MNQNQEKIPRKKVTLKRYEEAEKQQDEMSEEEYEKMLETIDVDDLIEEITPLLKDFFVGEFVNLHNMILCTFYNGEQFEISIEKKEE